MNARTPLSRPQQVKLTVDDFLLLDKAGAFDGYYRTELIDGAIVTGASVAMSPQHVEHIRVHSRLFRRIADACDALSNGSEAWIEGSIAMPPHSMPIPDIFVTSEALVGKTVRLETVVLLVEVSVTTVAYDLRKKAAIYALSGVREYWVVDIPGRSIHQMWGAKGKAFREGRKIAMGDRVDAVTIPGLSVDTDYL